MILDSCILIDVSRRKQEAVNFINGLREIPSVSALTVTEVVRGVRNAREAVLFENLFSKWSIVPVTFEIAVQAGELLKQYGRSHGLDIVDVVIAVSALIRNEELITLNLKHFPMFPGLTQPY